MHLLLEKYPQGDKRPENLCPPLPWRGFAQLLLLTDPDVPLDPMLDPLVPRIDYDALADRAMMQAINRLIEAAPGIWFYDCFNAEYLFHPFCETRNICEMLAFHTQERRDAMLS